MALVSPVLTGIGIGLALAGAPGPVQAVLIREAVRGGTAQGFRAMLGANMTFGVLLVLLALGLSMSPPRGPVLRLLQVAGGAFLIWLAVDGFRSGHSLHDPTAESDRLPSVVKGALAVVLNPGGWLFLGAVAGPLFATAARSEGTASVLVLATVLIAGIAVGDSAVVMFGAVGLRRTGDGVRRLVLRCLAVLLAVLGVWLLLTGVLS